MFFSLGTIGLSRAGGRTPSTLLQAASHNQRTEQRERGARAHIDPALTHLNEHLLGPDTPGGVVALALDLMLAAGVVPDKLRRDHAQAVELLFSLPPDTAIDTGAYFRQCVAWAGERFGVTNILSADVHHDEPAPHLHILLLPLVDGLMNAKAMKTKAELAKLRESFGREVAQQHGLKAVGRMNGAMRGAAFRAVLARLESSADPVLKSPLWQTVRSDIHRDPMPYVEALGLEVQKTQRKTRTLTEIMTSKGRSTSEDRRGKDAQTQAKAIAFDGRDDAKAIAFEAEKGQRLSCVAFALATAPIQAPDAGSGGSQDAGQAETGGDWVRVRDGDEGPGDDHAQVHVHGRCDQVHGRCDQVHDQVQPRGVQRVASGGDRVRGRGEAVPARQRTSPIRVKPDAVAGTPAGHEIDGDDVERLRDAELPAGYWNPDTGEFAAPAGRDRPARGGASP